MKDTNEKALLQEALQRMAEDMDDRDIDAIIWNIAQAGFHFIPEIKLPDRDGRPHTVRVTGIYRYEDKLYAIEEDVADIHPDQFYTPGVEVPPIVVTLTRDKAREILGDPETRPGFTTEGTTLEWLAIADCYFEALAEE